MPRKAKNRRLYERNRALVLADAHACTWCGVGISAQLPRGHPQKATADHVVPASRGGTDELHNLVPACARCNSRRGNRNPAVLMPPRQRSREW